MNKDRLLKQLGIIDSVHIEDLRNWCSLLNIVRKAGTSYKRYQNYKGEVLPNNSLYRDYMVKKNEIGLKQIPEEFVSFIITLSYLRITSFLEIGTFCAGTFSFMHHYLRRFYPALTSVTIDIVCTGHGMQELLGDGAKFYIGDFSAIADLEFDLVFIDGDHTYEGVKADYEKYKDRAKIIAFHDIVCEPDVGKFWKSIRGKNYEEFVCDAFANGIGVLY